jgi:hypothetical protein
MKGQFIETLMNAKYEEGVIRLEKKEQLVSTCFQATWRKITRFLR